jgi:DNA invertase Pin-like site-specific DNA recombinase
MPRKPPASPLIGYARVSTQGQGLTQQRGALRGAGCTRIFEEKVSGAKRDRPELGRLLEHLRAGDVVTVTRLDRLARSTRDLLEIAERIKEAGAGLRSLAEPWADTTTPAGRMVLTVFAGIADFERSLIVERTSAGRIAAKARGVRFGPKPSLSAEKIAHARQLVEQENRPVSEVAKLLGVHRATLYRALGTTPNKEALATLVRGITPENVHGEVSFGSPIGQELI